MHKSKNSKEKLIHPKRWIRKGLTFEEKIKKRESELPPNVSYTNLINIFDLVKQSEPGNFMSCVFDGVAHAIAKVAIESNDLEYFCKNIKNGIAILRASLYSYPQYPLVYTRIAIPVRSVDKEKDLIGGKFVEYLADFTEANFQEWALTLSKTKKLMVDTCDVDNEPIESGIVEIPDDVITALIEAINKADSAYRKIPESKRNFNAAAQSFYQDHPEPFLFDN